MPFNEAKLDKPYQTGDRGKKVKLIQECLCLSDFAVKVDGVFGVATEQSVRGFQTKKGVPVTGTVDQSTMDHLVGPIERATTPIAGTGKTIAQLAVEYAQQHLVEHPLEIGGPNCGPWVRLYMDGNEGPSWSWCAGFVTHVLAAAAKSAGSPIPVKRTYSCDILAAEGKAAGKLVSDKDVIAGTKQVSAGSIFLIRKTSTDWVHTGLVLSVHDGVYETIEGNTNDSGDHDGYEVCKRIRAIKNVDFIQI